MATVAGFTTADIHAAAQSAGAGGEVIFPAGTYASAGLKVQYADQTWIGTRQGRTIIKRTDTTLENALDVEADGFRLRSMTIDGNRAVNPNVAVGVQSTGFSVDMRDFDLVGASHWGISVSDADLILRDGAIRKTGQAGVFWRITSNGSAMAGPDIDRVNVSRSDPNDYIGAGGFHIQSLHATARIAGTSIQNCKVTLPQGAAYSAVGIEVWNADRALVSDDEVIGGRIGVSFGGASFGVIQGNRLSKCFNYHIELANGSANNAVTGNTIQGTGTSSGIENSGQSNWNRIGGNTIFACKKPVRIAPGCNGCRVFDN